MSALTQAIIAAFDKEGNSKEANKAYLEFIKANYIIPIEKDDTAEEPKVLFLNDNQQTFLPVFSESTFFDLWVDEIKDDIQVLKLSGVDLLKGVADDVIVCLDIGQPHFKEFHTQELARMRSIILKFFQK